MFRVERRRSVALAVAGLVAALALFLLGRPSAEDLRAAVADLDALIRENAAGVQARADTLAQLPRLGWAVATDEKTVRDLTTEELSFRTHPGEHIEIAQIPKGGGEPRRLLHLPDDSDLQLPVTAGTRVVVRGNRAHVVTVVTVEPRQRADELSGSLAVAKELETSAIQQRLAARGIDAELRTVQGSSVLAGRAPQPSSIDARIPLTGASGQGASVVAANVGRARWPRIVSPFVLVLSLAAAGLLWRRGAGASVRMAAAAAGASAPTRLPEPTPIGGVPAATADRSPGLPPPGVPAPRLPPPRVPASRVRTPHTPPSAPPQATPSMGYPIEAIDSAAPLAEVPRERVLTGRVEIMLARSGSVSVPPVRSGPGSAGDPDAEADPRAEEYRALFLEFLNLRRTTGESVEGLDVRQFVRTLREKRAQIMKQIPVKDVRFKLAFQNGKAGIRYMTVN